MLGAIASRAVRRHGLVTTQRRLLSKEAFGSFELDGPGKDAIKPRVAESAWIAPSATLLGDIEIAEDASVWFNVVVRGDRDLIRIGKRTNIQDGSVLHTDAGRVMDIGDDVTVGHMAMLHGCKIHNNTLIGIGAVVLDGYIGPNCLIGANALITEGKKIPEGSLVTGVNKVARSLTPEEIEGLTRSAAGYVQNQKRYRATLTKTE
ncbi:Gamma carbonic anhydrase 1, mitochondrial [Hondaea fermentalgiana]|uniref:Gamma carbonic anhydrase 1, mitochondrial n=1 Tax=Hondaea fermentalgiana TaxID=2315210 RepID=A0A2R5G759_9STRA|nr:Gamma carbonic anhydrase 1, mitochondrial [Hondaea fermentalgiana]|eukprot:GBG26896.1 Gamma carbonic anhydrase 1, mitochondrial [Hondaea fermentalgiana]